ncbi:placenta-specific gene 8 protein [Stegastes partitus]|uniref:Placenta associated 8 n=1 Tax=Stegastes partitus TaxID=144197 RepID=A0A3B5B3Y2_9TELE|nr:PREDICTED: placenta-specific gene 8 protein [Stegastes partitus]
MPVTNQPGRYELADFQSGMFQCHHDIKICLLGSFCVSCLGCIIASDMDECCLCGMDMAIRSVYRTRYNIKGSMCNDCVAMSCCRPCTLCQLKRDIDLRKQQNIF